MSVAARSGRRVLAIVLFAWWATADGGYAPGAWYPGALLVLAALAGCRPSRVVPARCRLRRGGRSRRSPASRPGASARSHGRTRRGDAWDGANRTLLYLTVFALFALVPWTAAWRPAGLGAFALATARSGALEIARALAGDAPAVFFDGRLGGADRIRERERGAVPGRVLGGAPARRAPADAGGRARRPARGRRAAAPAHDPRPEPRLADRGRRDAAVAVALGRATERRCCWRCPVAARRGASLPALLERVRRRGAGRGAGPRGRSVIAMGLSAAALFAWGLRLGPAARWVGAHARCVAHARDGRRPPLLVAAAAGGLALAGGPDRGRRAARRLALRGRPRLGPLRLLACGRAGVREQPDRRRRRRQLRARLRARPGRPRGAALPPQPRAARRSPRPGSWAPRCWRSSSARWRCPSGRPTTCAGRSRSPRSSPAPCGSSHGSIDWLWEIPAVAAPAMAALGLAVGLGPRGTPPAPTRVASGARIVGGAGVRGGAVLCVAGAVGAGGRRRRARVERRLRRGAAPARARARRSTRCRTAPTSSPACWRARPATDDGARRAFLAALDRDARNWNVHVEVALLDLRDGRAAAAAAPAPRARPRAQPRRAADRQRARRDRGARGSAQRRAARPALRARPARTDGTAPGRLPPGARSRRSLRRRAAADGAPPQPGAAIALAQRTRRDGRSAAGARARRSPLPLPAAARPLARPAAWR